MKNGDYELVIAPDEYPGKKYRGRYCYEHHLAWWMETGELINSGEIVHHINGNKRDNRIKNLDKMTIAQHNVNHVRDSARGATYTQLTCAKCGVAFERLSRSINYNRKIGQSDFYCDRSCMGGHFGRGRSKNGS